MDVWWDTGDSTLLSRWPHIQEALSVQMEERSERSQEELGQAGGSLDGRVRQVLLPKSW